MSARKPCTHVIQIRYTLTVSQLPPNNTDQSQYIYPHFPLFHHSSYIHVLRPWSNGSAYNCCDNLLTRTMRPGTDFLKLSQNWGENSSFSAYVTYMKMYDLRHA